MTNLEALKAQSVILSSVPDNILEFQLEDQGLTANDTYVKDNRKAIDLAFASLILYVSSQATSLRELDWAITNVSMADLLKLRASLLNKWGISDGMSPTIRGVSVW